MAGQYTPTPSAQSVTNSFTDTGAGSWITVRGYFNVSLSGNGVGTYKLEKSYQGGDPIDVSLSSDGDPASFAKTTSQEISLLCYEPESGVRWRWNCTADSSGTTDARISQ